MVERKYWDKKLETMPRKELERYQLKLLKSEVEFARRGSPYYKKALPKVDLKSVDDLRKLPFVTKHDIRERQLAAPPFGDMCAVPERDIVYISASSGSTGVPTASPFTGQDFDDFIDCEARLFWRSGMRPTDRYIHALNFSLFIGGPCVLGAQKLGALSIHAGTVPSERLLAFIQQFKPNWTWTTPSYAWYLGETAIKMGLDPAKDLSIRNIIVSGEPGGAIKATREKIEELWGANLYEYYGLSDIFGANAGSCTHKSGIHIEEDHQIVEVLDRNGEPVGEGERGEMVLTTLKKRARPLIRFKTGDIVTYTNEKCECGRTFKRLHGIVGRTDDMLIIKGVNVFPSDVEAIVRSKAYLSGEYQIIVDRKEHLDTLTVEIEAAVGKSDGEVQDTLAGEIKARLGVTAKIIVLPSNSIPRSTHKAKRVIDRREHVWE